ncbi:helix-turn-helix domain-containing protein [Litoribrevibacter euphylliae]|uniref:Helix-turn-helix domain-containing protein n=1 Tax=Litoribrevibacter euphylliae TaxID=1834034 RepID=A0ABV7HKH7_9GAMM
MNKILHIRPEHAVFMGDFGFASKHRHGALVLLIGMSGPFRVQISGEPVMTCRSALIDANVEHTVDCQSEHLATLYFELSSPLGRALKHTFLDDASAAFDVVKATYFNQRIERRLLAADLPSLLCKPLEFPSVDVDSRIIHCLSMMQDSMYLESSQTDVADMIGVSNSRLNHLFKQSVGIPFRHYKLWSKLSLFMHDYHATESLTDSALNSGFSDASHLSNSYRKVFGITPSKVLTDLDEFVISK